jgi:HrpA-like RNA helicase
MLDEAHELRKQGLFILAILRNMVRKSQGHKKLIVTSATLDTELFEDYFRGMKCVIIEAITPTYDVEVHYTYFPDLEANIIDNTSCHLKMIFDVGYINSSISRETSRTTYPGCRTS